MSIFDSRLAKQAKANMTKALVGFCGLYAIATVFNPLRRIQMEWSGLSNLKLVQILFETQLYVAILFVPVVLVLLDSPRSRFSVWWNRIINFRLVLVCGFAMLIATILLTVYGIPGYWWMWQTLGLLVAAIILTVIILRGRINTGETVLTGGAFVCLACGLWEIPYQIGLKYIYDLPQIGMAEAIIWVRSEIAIELPFIMGGGAILLLQNYKYHFLNFNYWSLLLFGLAAGFYLAWFATGFWVDVSYNWDTHTWIQSDPNAGAMLIYRASKAFTVLGFVSLVLPRRAKI